MFLKQIKIMFLNIYFFLNNKNNVPKHIFFLKQIKIMFLNKHIFFLKQIKIYVPKQTYIFSQTNKNNVYKHICFSNK